MARVSSALRPSRAYPMRSGIRATHAIAAASNAFCSRIAQSNLRSRQLPRRAPFRAQLPSRIQNGFVAERLPPVQIRNPRLRQNRNPGPRIPLPQRPQRRQRHHRVAHPICRAHKNALVFHELLAYKNAGQYTQSLFSAAHDSSSLIGGRRKMGIEYTVPRFCTGFCTGYISPPLT